MKNNFAPINRIPSEVFFVIPEHLEEDELDENLIALTHVCRGWRELLIARPSLWTRLDCTNIDKTHVYIERSKISPLDLSLRRGGNIPYHEDAFLLVVPYISRLKSLSIDGMEDILQVVTPHISCFVPLLRELTIDLGCDPIPVLNGALFNGDLSSLHSLSLAGVITNLPWKNLSKLTTFKLSRVPEGKISITQLLNFFEDAHHLRDITLQDSIPTSSNAPPERVVPLPCLKILTILADPVHSTLLNHLSIPAGASVTLDFAFNGNRSPLPNFLPKDPGKLKNTFPTTSVNLSLGVFDKYVRLDGPSGGLYILGHGEGWDRVTSAHLDNRILRSLTYFVLSGIQRLAVTDSNLPATTKFTSSPAYQLLYRMKDLHTLTLTRSSNVPFILALNPDLNPTKSILCPNLKELVLYIERRNAFNLPELMSMAEERALRHTKLSSITIVGLGELLPGKEVFKLKEYVSHVDYKFREKPPSWDSISENGDD